MPMTPTREQITAMPEPVRRRYLRVFRVFAFGAYLVLGSITVAALVPGRPRTVALFGIAAGVLIGAGAFLYAFKASYRVLPPPPPSGDGAAHPPDPPPG